MKTFVTLFTAAIMCAVIAGPAGADTSGDLFAEGVRHLEAGRFEEVRDKINSSDHLASLYYFYMGDYRTALSFIKRTDLKETRHNLYLYLKHLIEMTQEFDEFETPHFLIRLSKNDYVLKSDIKDTLERVYSVIGMAFSYFPHDRVIIEIYPDKESFAFASTLGDKTLERSGAIGICKFNRLMIVSPSALPQGYRWLDSLCHEYVHFVINRITKNNCPLWLHEGIARYHDTLWRVDPPVYTTPGSVNLLKDALEKNALISFTRMSPSMVYLENQDEVALAFAQVSSAVDFIKSAFPGRFRQLLPEMSQSTPDDAFKKCFGMGLVKFEKEWTAHIKRQQFTKAEGALPDRITWEKADEIEQFVGISARDFIRLGDRFRMRGNNVAAMAEYEKGLKIEPFNPVILLKLARTLFSSGDFGRAAELLNACIEKNPNYVSAYELLGDYYLKISEWSKSVEMNTHAVSINPFNPSSHIALAKARLSLGEREKALVGFQNALLLEPGNPFLMRMVRELTTKPDAWGGD
ncbi:MAG: tetratricopeptide repeat protein [Elusimicrobia bacterium]|nr:tetratricopeptide repeat protein [Elusimicrobiota bacterium]